MAVGFYVTIVRGKRVGWLLGPYADEPAARAEIPRARELAEAADPFTCFDAFGTVRIEAPLLPGGVFGGPNDAH